MEITQTLIDFAWYDLTEHQQDRIKLKFQLQIMLDERLENETKTSIYKFLANKYNLHYRTVEDIAYKLNK